jgi:hypothetical protein
MNAIVLDDIPFRIEMNRLLNTLSIKADSPFAREVAELVEMATAIGRPKVVYRKAHIDSRGEGYIVVEGVALKSIVLQINTQETDTVYPFVATCGKELEDWSNRVDGLSRFYAEAIKELALDAAEVAFARHIEGHFDPSPTSEMNPGSIPDWRVKEQSNLFAILGDLTEGIEVSLSKSYMMSPTKSTSGIRYYAAVKFVSCQLCQEGSCPSREAPYDAELYNRKYRVTI